MNQTQALTVEEICNKLRPVFGKKIDSVYLRYAMSETREEKEEIASILHALYNKHLSLLLNQNILLEPPIKDLDGEYKLAQIIYAEKVISDFNLREQDFVRHICISGMSGSGKTTMAFHIINNFLDKSKPFLIFDWKKSFRPLLTRDGEIMHFSVGDNKVSNLFKTNINQPPKGVNPKEWINVLCDLLTEAFSVSFGVHKVVLETLDEAFKEWGIYNGSENYPTWHHIKWRLDQKMQSASGREATWLESAARIASVLTFGSFAEVVNYKGENSMNIEDLLNNKVILELNSLGNIEKKFFCDFVLTYIFKLKKARQNNVNGKFDHAIIVDEAHNIFLKKDTSFANESVTDMIYREMREYGTSLICLDQHISKLSDTVKGNSACHIAFQQQLPMDIRDISGIMQLQDNANYFTKLPVGMAIVKLSERHTRPFLIKVSEVDLRKEEVSDFYIKKRMQAMFSSKQVQAGLDTQFEQELKNPGQDNLLVVEDESSINEARANRDEENILKKYEKEKKTKRPHHAIYDGEVQRVERLKNKIKEDLKKPLELLKQEKYFPELKYTAEEQFTQKEEGQKNKEIINFREVKPFQIINHEEDKIQEIEIQETKNDPIEELKIRVDNEFLNPIQKILYDYVDLRLMKGKSLSEIERVIEDNIDYSLYSLKDVAIVINHLINKRTNILEKKQTFDKEHLSIPKDSLKDNVTTSQKEQKQKVYKAEIAKISTKNISNNDLTYSDKLNNEQKMFLAFLQENPMHNLSSVEFYKKIGLSSRKGTVIKKELLEKGLIKEDAIKYDKGWKKIIRLN